VANWSILLNTLAVHNKIGW